MNLKTYRKRANLSQKETAEKLNIAQGSYSNYENNKREPDIKTLLKLSKLFNTSIDNLVGNTTGNLNSLTQPELDLINIFQQLSPMEQGELLGYAKKALKQEKSKK